MRKVRHSREGGNPVLLAITLLDSRLRGNDRLADSRASSTLCYSFERTFVSGDFDEQLKKLRQLAADSLKCASSHALTIMPVLPCAPIVAAEHSEVRFQLIEMSGLYQ